MPSLQYASKPLAPLINLSHSLRSFPSFSRPWTRHPAISFLVLLFVLLWCFAFYIIYIYIIYTYLYYTLQAPPSISLSSFIPIFLTSSSHLIFGLTLRLVVVSCILYYLYIFILYPPSLSIPWSISLSLSLRSFPSFSRPWTPHPAISFLVLHFILYIYLCYIIYTYLYYTQLAHNTH